jgi:hypothetical protein
MRDYYKIMHSDWLNAVNDAKKIAAQSGNPFTEILSEGQKNGTYAGTPVIDEQFHNLQKQKFEMIQGFVQGKGENLQKEAELNAG